MNLKQKAIVNSIGSLTVFFAQWLISVLIVRINGYEEAGIFSLAMTISNIFNFFSNYNIRNYQISDVKCEYTQLQYFYSRIFTSLLSFLACMLYLIIASGYNNESKYAIFIYLIYSNINSISDIMLGSLQLKNNLEINGYSNMIRGISCFAGFMFFYYWKKNLICSLCAMSIIDFIVTYMYDGRLFTRAEGKIKRPQKKDTYAILNILKCCFPLMLSSMFPIITTAIPRRQIQLIYGEESLGIFSTIFTPTVLITTLAPALILAMIPVITDYWKQYKKKELCKIIFECYSVCGIITIIAEMFALFWGSPIMKLIFGKTILQYYDLLYWAIIVTGVNSMTSCGNAVLISMRRNKSVAFSALMSMLITLFFSYILIKKYYIYGAAYILLLAYIIQILLQIAAIIISVITFKKGLKKL